jgi:putative ABC transport system permease protein
MKGLGQDLRYGVRMLVKSPSFTIVAVFALALGIGASSAIFTVVNSVLLRPLPFGEPDRIVWLWGKMAKGNRASVSVPDFLDYRSQNRTFEHLAALINVEQPFNLTGDAEPERISGVRVTANYFQALGVAPQLGRTFFSEEEQPGKEQVAVISHDLWKRRFAADPKVVGSTITLDNKNFTIVGILPRYSQFPQRAEIWTPVAFSPEKLPPRSAHFLRPIGRLKQGVTIEQAQADIDAVAKRLEEQYPDSNTSWSALLVPMHEVIVGQVRPALLVLLCGVGFVLLIACANVANLQLARSVARQKEIAVRMAIGAGRWRIVRQLFTENLLLSASGGMLGILFTLWGIDLLVAMSPENIPRINEVSVDLRVLGFTLLLSLLTGLLFGLAPAIQASRPDLNETLKEGGRAMAGGLRSRRIRSMLVISEVTLSLVLLIGAGLMIKSFVRLLQVDPGFNTENVLTMQIALPASKYATKQQCAAYYQQALERIGGIAEVETAGLVSELPMSGQQNDIGFSIEGRPAQKPGERFGANCRLISSGYFATMGIPLLKGRYPDERDDRQGAAENPSVIIINEIMASRYFGSEDPIGKRLIIHGGREDHTFEIVGIVGNISHYSLGSQMASEMYIPIMQNNAMNLVVRTRTEPAMVRQAIKSSLLSIDKDQPVANIRTMEQVVSNSVAQPRFRTTILGVFAAAALILAAVGIYGVMAYSVTQRTHEIGIRMALGAQRRDVFRLVIGEAMKIALIGILFGLAGAFALTRLVESLLFGISSKDPVTYAGVSVLMIAVVLAASYFPARRAIKIDPMVALRYE